MAFYDLVKKARTVRRFEQNRPVSHEQLMELVKLAQITPSAANLQPLRYLLVCDPAKTKAVNECLLYAGYIPNWTQQEGERPAAYVVILRDAKVAKAGNDVGIVAQTMMLGAAEQGIGCCMLGAIRRDELRICLAIPQEYEIELVLALGYPVEQVVLEPMEKGDVHYWRDEKQVHHVPKRSLEELVLQIEECP